MTSADTLPLLHSWPLFEREQRFDLGVAMDEQPVAALPLETAIDGIGGWQCDLHDDCLTWSRAVYDLFGLPREADLVRNDILPLYAEGSRAMMERLRAYAIRHRRGFTLDAELRPANGGRKWMRLIAAPVVVYGRVVSLQGLKREVTSQYQ